MYCQTRTFRDKLDSGKLCVGPGITLADPAVTESLGAISDFVWIDLEHNPTNLESMLAHLIAARASRTMSIVRVPSRELGWIKRVLDSGAEGIILPQGQNYQEIAEFVSACRYPPLGTRGFGPRRPTNYGRITGTEYLEMANRELFVVAQIETAGALRDVEKIVAIPGLDSIVLGPQDLSGSLGIMGQMDHPDLVRAMQRVISVSRGAGRYVGMGMGASPEFATRAANWGVQWIQIGNDIEYMNRFAQQLYDGVRKDRTPDSAT